MISVHDGFIGLNEWNGFFEGADRVALDSKHDQTFALIDADLGTSSPHISRVWRCWE
jgi:uncharacterized protein YerC